jgi:hypothetical protein
MALNTYGEEALRRMRNGLTPVEVWDAYQPHLEELSKWQPSAVVQAMKEEIQEQIQLARRQLYTEQKPKGRKNNARKSR